MDDCKYYPDAKSLVNILLKSDEIERNMWIYYSWEMYNHWMKQIS